MPDINTIPASLAENWWSLWLLSTVLVVAAVIDGWKLRVPNWITFPLIMSGWIYSAVYFGWAGLAWSVLGTIVGLGLLLPAYAIGGMGAGDVKLLAGIGAWAWSAATLYAFCVSAVVGGAIAVGMVLLATRLASASSPVLVYYQRDSRSSQSEHAFGHCRRAQEFHAVAALWDSNCDRDNSLFSLDSGAPMKLPNSPNMRSCHLNRVQTESHPRAESELDGRKRSPRRQIPN